FASYRTTGSLPSPRRAKPARAPLPGSLPRPRARRAVTLHRRDGGGLAALAVTGGDELVDLGAVEDLALEESLGDRVQDVEVGAQERAGAVVAVGHEAADLGVDLRSGALGVALGLVEVAAEEDVLVLRAEGHRPELVAHAPLADHLAGELARALEVVAGAGRHVAEDELLGGAAAEEDREVVLELLAAGGVAVVDRDLLREPERHAARDDRDLVDRVGARDELRDQRVTGLVVGRVPLLLLADDHRSALGAHHDLVLRELEVEMVHLVLVRTRGEERRLVHEVLEVGAGEAGRGAGEERDVDVVGERDATRVHADDALAALHVGSRDDDATVEAAGAEERGVEHVGAVRRGDQDDALVRLEAVHLDKQLLQGLLALVVPAAEARGAVAADGVDLVDEDDAGGVLLALDEEVADARRADTDEHLDEVGARDREERHAGLARDGAREERLAGTRRPDEQHTLRDPAAELRELLRVLEERDDLLELLLRLLDPGHVGERVLLLRLGQELGAALPEGHRLAAAHLHLAHEENPDADQEEHRHPLHEQDDVPGVALF